MLQPAPELLDAVYLDAMQKSFDQVLEQAERKLAFFRREIESLTTQDALPPPYRDAYRQMVAVLTKIEQSLREESMQDFTADEALLQPLFQAKQESSPALAAAAQETIEQLNAAERRLNRVVETAQALLIEQAPAGLIDWTMPFEYEFTFLLDPGPARAFYRTCADGEEPLRLALSPAGPYSPRAPHYNWNIFEGRAGHPLQTGHHGYLVHCLLDHLGLPWPLLPFIHEVEINLTFTDFETVWERPSPEPS